MKRKESLKNLIEDYNSENAPKECIIGQVNERTHEKYVQLNCCKNGWTYVDVSDKKWLLEHNCI